MNSDRLIALSDNVPTTLSNPLMLGALRSPDQSPEAWVIDARQAARKGERVVLAGDFSNQVFILHSLTEIDQTHDSAHFAVLLHWTQAVDLFLSPELTRMFDEVYVAIDQPVPKEKLAQISQRWNAQWVVLPSTGVTWSRWIPEILFQGKKGSVIFLAPGGVFHEQGFLPPDELRLELDSLAFFHPEIKVEPAPCEWFIPSELGPWNARNRNDAHSSVVRDTRAYPFYRYTAVVPFRLKDDPQDLALLEKCLNSIGRTFPNPGECETIIAIDYEAENKIHFDQFQKNLMTGCLGDHAIIAVPRFQDSDDWRAGFVRNVGALHATTVEDSLEASTLLFIDSDVELSDAAMLRERTAANDFDVLQLADHPEHTGFERATSMFMAVQYSFFWAIGGFAEAFSNYGGEDNFLVWKAARLGARIRSMPRSNILHLREPRESDDLFLKMIRLQASSHLMYRMTLDPKVHRHFFVSTGLHIYFRGIAKSLCEHIIGRMLLAPFVFLLTLIETDRPIAYLRGFFDVYVRRTYQVSATRCADLSRRSFYYLRHQSREGLRRSYYRSRYLCSEYSRRYYYFLRHICIEAYFFVRHHCRRICLTAFYFSWHLYSVYSRKIYYFVRHQYREISRNCYYKALHFRDVLSLFLLKVFGILKIAYGRVLPKIYGIFDRLRGQLPRICGPFHLLYGKLYGAYAISVGFVKANLWIFSEPTAWFTLKTPRFYKWVWRPLMKTRYFFTYHLFTRWRNS